MKQRTYLAIDLKSFYASVECRERGLDPLNTNLVVADESRTDKTICLAVTPTLKSYGISGRGRLFEVRQRVREVNAWRQARAPGRTLTGSSHQFSELQRDPALAVDFVIAPPRMAYYMEYSTRIYEIYRKYIAPEDIVVYSIDEVFLDVTDYPYDCTAHEPSSATYSKRPASRRRPASGRTCSSPRSPWTLWQSTFRPMKTACASQSSMK